MGMINTCDEKVEEAVPEELPALNFCSKKHKKCGHACKGVENERNCLPCLNKDCAEAVGHYDGVNEDELCTICYT